MDIFALENKAKQLHSTIDEMCNITTLNFAELDTRVQNLEEENRKLKERNMQMTRFLDGIINLLKEEEDY